MSLIRLFINFTKLCFTFLILTHFKILMFIFIIKHDLRMEYILCYEFSFKDFARFFTLLKLIDLSNKFNFLDFKSFIHMSSFEFHVDELGFPFLP